MKTASILTIGCAAMALSITSCTNFGSPNTYNLNEIGGAQETYTGTVTSVENVKIQANNANTGTGIGAVAGGLTGAMFGGGNAKSRRRRAAPFWAALPATRLTRPSTTRPGNASPCVWTRRGTAPATTRSSRSPAGTTRFRSDSACA